MTNNFRHHGYVFKQFGDFQTFFSDEVKFLIFEKNKGHVTRRRKSAFSLNFENFLSKIQTIFFSKFKFNNFLEQILKSADVLTLKNPSAALYNQVEMNLSQACTYFLTEIV